MKRPTKRVLLRSEAQREYAIQLLKMEDMDAEHPREFLIRDMKPQRTVDQNALMWAGIMSTIQSEMKKEGFGYTQDAWHMFCKSKFLPDEQNPPDDFEEDDIRDGYQKWLYLPNGERHLNGSTTQLTKKGFSKYLDKICAYFANEYGVEFLLRA